MEKQIDTEIPDNLKAAIKTFKVKKLPDTNNDEKSQKWLQNIRRCEFIGTLTPHDFLEHAKEYNLEGIILTVENPYQHPTRGWDQWGGDWRTSKSPIFHSLAYFPKINVSVDFTAHYFWENCSVPLIQNLEILKKEWDEFPFGITDKRDIKIN